MSYQEQYLETLSKSLPNISQDKQMICFCCKGNHWTRDCKVRFSYIKEVSSSLSKLDCVGSGSNESSTGNDTSAHGQLPSSPSVTSSIISNATAGDLAMSERSTPFGQTFTQLDHYRAF